MDIPVEITLLRAGQCRLRESLDRMDKRIDDIDRRWRDERTHPPAVPPTETPPPDPKPEPIVEPVPPGPVEKSIPPKPLPLQAYEDPKPDPAPEPAAESLELRLGRVWLVRAGILILLTGLVFLGNYAYHEYIGRLGPLGKLLLIYLAGGGLCGLGAWLGKRQETLRNYARVLLAGGCATLYYATYAAHFVAPLRVIESPVLAGALLLGLGGGFIALADRFRSQTLAAATIALTFYVSAINPIGGFSLFSNLVVSMAAIALLTRRRWVSVSFLSLAGAYGSYAFWHWQQAHTFLPVAAVDSFWPALLFPAAYWLVHTAAVMLRRVSALDPASRPTFLTLNNAAFFALAGPVVAGTHPESFWLATLAFGAVLVGLAIVAGRRSADEPLLDGAYLSQGMALVLLGLVYKFTGWQEAISFALLSATLVSLGRLRHGVIFRLFAGISALVSTSATVDAILHAAPHARLVAGAVAAIFAATSWILKRQTSEPSRCDWRVLAYVLLGAALSLPACLDGNAHLSALRILAVAIAAMIAARWLRLPELAYAAQPLALCGQAALILDALAYHLPAGDVLTSALSALAFVFLWKWKYGTALAGERTWQILHLLAPVALALWWSSSQLDPSLRGPVIGGMALAVVGLGWLARIPVIAAASAPFTAASIIFVMDALGSQAPWLSPAGSVALLLAQSFVLRLVTTQSLPAQLLRATCAMLGAAMVFAYLPAASWFTALILAALTFFLATCLHRNNETMLCAGGLFLVATVVWMSRLLIPPAQGIDLVGFLALAIAQRVGKRRLADGAWFGAEMQALLCSVAVLGSWIVLHRMVSLANGGFLLTITWSLLALAVLGGGFALRERTYRILGLVILAAAIGRIFCFDVWQLETIYRIVSFLVLGAVLLALGFLYNRCAETLRRWL